MDTSHTVLGLALLTGATTALANPVLPGAGQTVHWTRAMSPIQITGQPTIPDTGTVIIDPGVQVAVAANSYLLVAGTLVVAGDAQDRVRISGPTTAAVITSNGTLDFAYADVDLQVGAAGFDPALDNDAGIFRYCAFGANSLINASWHVNVLESCSYSGARPVTVRNAGSISNFTSTRTVHLREGIFSLNNLSVNGAAGAGPEQTSGLYVTGHLIPTAIDNVTVTGNAGAGIFSRFGNVVIGSNTTNQNNLVAVHLDRTAGLMTGSNVPQTGNTLNGFIPVNDANGVAHLAPLPDRPVPVQSAPALGSDWIWGSLGFTDTVWGNVGIPYGVTGMNGSVNGGSLSIAPGVTTLLAPGAVLHTYDTGRMSLRGTPESPLLFSRLFPAQAWGSLTFTSFGVVSNATVEGATIGLSTGGATTMPELLDCTFRDNDTGLLRGSRPRKSRFLNNRIAAADHSTSTYQTRLQLSTPGCPNAFIGNAQGVYEDPNDLVNAVISAEYNWWGSTTGPRAVNNPGGTGDSVEGFVNAVPFRTTAPDFSDHLPLIRIKPTGLLEPLAKTTLRWEASDDRGIAAFRISYATASNVNHAAYTHLATLPGTAREYELTVPNVAFFNSRDTFIRVAAIDSAGQESVDELVTTIPNSIDRPLQISLTNVPSGTVLPGTRINPRVQRTVFDAAFSNAFEVYLSLDNDGVLQHVGNGDTSTGGLYLTAQVPTVSTDAARLVIKFQGTGNLQKWFDSAPFTIRPDARFGDAPPEVNLSHSPTIARAGSDVALAWTASDDKSLRLFRILGSTDAGRTWHLVQDNIPSEIRHFQVRLASGSGFADLRLRVVAVDSLFQNSAATTAAILVVPGARCSADFDGDGDVGTDADIEAFFRCLAGQCCVTCGTADVNDDGDFATDADIEAFFRVLAGGAC